MVVVVVFAVEPESFFSADGIKYSYLTSNDAALKRNPFIALAGILELTMAGANRACTPAAQRIPRGPRACSSGGRAVHGDDHGPIQLVVRPHADIGV